MLCDSDGRNETCEMLVYMPAKTCDAFRDGGGPPKKRTQMEKKDACVGISDDFGDILTSLVLVA